MAARQLSVVGWCSSFIYGKASYFAYRFAFRAAMALILILMRPGVWYSVTRNGRSSHLGRSNWARPLGGNDRSRRTEAKTHNDENCASMTHAKQRGLCSRYESVVSRRSLTVSNRVAVAQVEMYNFVTSLGIEADAQPSAEDFELAANRPWFTLPFRPFGFSLLLS